jgi:hypothetical protein
MIGFEMLCPFELYVEIFIYHQLYIFTVYMQETCTYMLTYID